MLLPHHYPCLTHEESGPKRGKSLVQGTHRANWQSWSQASFVLDSSFSITHHTTFTPSANPNCPSRGTPSLTAPPSLSANTSPGCSATASQSPHLAARSQNVSFLYAEPRMGSPISPKPLPCWSKGLKRSSPGPAPTSYHFAIHSASATLALWFSELSEHAPISRPLDQLPRCLPRLLPPPHLHSP